MERTKENFNKITDGVIDILPDSYIQKNKPEKFNHVIMHESNEQYIGILWTEKRNNFEVDFHTYDYISSKTFISKKEMYEYIETYIND